MRAMQYVTFCRCGPHAILRSGPCVFALEHLALCGLWPRVCVFCIPAQQHHIRPESRCSQRANYGNFQSKFNTVSLQSTGNLDQLAIAIHWQSIANCNTLAIHLQLLPTRTPLSIHWQWQPIGRPTATANQMQHTMCPQTQCTLL